MGRERGGAEQALQEWHVNDRGCEEQFGADPGEQQRIGEDADRSQRGSLGPGRKRRPDLRRSGSNLVTGSVGLTFSTPTSWLRRAPSCGLAGILGCADCRRIHPGLVLGTVVLWPEMTAPDNAYRRPTTLAATSTLPSLRPRLPG